MPACNDLYGTLKQAGFDVLYDDTNERPGAKFKTMDLIGLPWQVRVGPRGLKESKVEITRRSTGVTVEMALADVVAHLRAA